MNTSLQIQTDNNYVNITHRPNIEILLNTVKGGIIGLGVGLGLALVFGTNTSIKNPDAFNPWNQLSITLIGQAVGAASGLLYSTCQLIKKSHNAIAFIEEENNEIILQENQSLNITEKSQYHSTFEIDSHSSDDSYHSAVSVVN